MMRLLSILQARLRLLALHVIRLVLIVVLMMLRLAMLGGDSASLAHCSCTLTCWLLLRVLLIRNMVVPVRILATDCMVGGSGCGNNWVVSRPLARGICPLLGTLGVLALLLPCAGISSKLGPLLLTPTKLSITLGSKTLNNQE